MKRVHQKMYSLFFLKAESSFITHFLSLLKFGDTDFSFCYEIKFLQILIWRSFILF